MVLQLLNNIISKYLSRWVHTPIRRFQIYIFTHLWRQDKWLLYNIIQFLCALYRHLVVKTADQINQNITTLVDV